MLRRILKLLFVPETDSLETRLIKIGLKEMEGSKS